MPRLIVQPEGSELCGQCCVAMAAGISLDRSTYILGTEGTTTRDLVVALRALRVPCADRSKRISRSKPRWPARAVLTIHRPAEAGVRRHKWHWMLAWDGHILDPGNAWPERYTNWRITSYLEIYKEQR
jgi:hypothetical protein